MHATGAIPGHVGAATVARQRKQAAAAAQAEALLRAEAAARAKSERDAAFVEAQNAAVAERAAKEMEFLMLEGEFEEADRAAERAARQSMAAIAELTKVLPSAGAAATVAANSAAATQGIIDGERIHADYVAAAARMAKTEEASNVLALRTSIMPVSPHAGVTVSISHAGHSGCSGEYSLEASMTAATSFRMGSTQWRIALGQALRVGLEGNDVSCKFDVCGLPDTWCIYSRHDWSVVYQTPRVGSPERALPPSTGWVCTDHSLQEHALAMPAVICMRSGKVHAQATATARATAPATARRRSHANSNRIGTAGNVSFAAGTKRSSSRSIAEYGGYTSEEEASSGSEGDASVFEGNWDGISPDEVFQLLDLDDNGYVTAAEFIKGLRKNKRAAGFFNLAQRVGEGKEEGCGNDTSMEFSKHKLDLQA